MKTLKEQVAEGQLPRHVAIIMDGNGRWAKKKGNKRIFGHKNGVAAVRETTEAAAEVGVDYLTLYAFSTENWNRPRTEVDALMSLLIQTINQETSTLLKNDVKLETIGDITSLPKDVQRKLVEAKEKTATNKRTTLTLALSYSSRWEINKALKNIAKKVSDGEIEADQVDETTLINHLETAQMPDPELLIRTSGEQRLSNFLLYQLAYSELYFTPKLWPDFRKNDFFEAILAFQSRERRFGKISEQLQKK
ncbi:Ditrans,polycis-undecaprenyl-diphosphate synthase ((2E,6E)-farnesyl-diphosphate specific) [Salinivirga cyanobacteriivorans]|uniref:Isoprenyl transferase n=1 Tax=Salinivirga cyanobacteriivorans TaxID=1307839 RepID=A0A0S2I2X4_9BACT|nr:isoprenyl transferase [Salinivirga cyanobacteriivorans]ALO16570.1 Ditrans,polycis-undecaprenyl-diphosphate synthase ((2E,6E)-farnesyl-diphosphate specific) [Salinivirga cyanobacteriivorans]